MRIDVFQLSVLDLSCPNDIFFEVDLTVPCSVPVGTNEKQTEENTFGPTERTRPVKPSKKDNLHNDVSAKYDRCLLPPFAEGKELHGGTPNVPQR